MWQDCRSLRALIDNEAGVWQPRYRHWRLGGTERFYDRGMMLFSTLTAAGAIVLACWLWISSGWNDGAGAVTLAAVACCFFAALDEPAPLVFRFFLSTCASVVLAGLYLFVVLPHVHDFVMLVLIFAGPFILIGTLIPRPQFNLVTMLVAVNTATFISIQDAYSADFLVFLNSNIAGVAGLLYAFVWTRATRPFGAELAARRLLRSSWEDVAKSASRQPIADQRNHASRACSTASRNCCRACPRPTITAIPRSRPSATCASRLTRSTCTARCAASTATYPRRSTACWPA